LKANEAKLKQYGIGNLNITHAAKPIAGSLLVKHITT